MWHTPRPVRGSEAALSVLRDGPMKTYSAKPKDVDKKWFVVDAEGLVLGRMASVLAMRLRGKHKPMFTPHIDCGDNIIVVNAKKVRLTGRKLQDRLFQWHTGYPGGIKSRTAGEILDGKMPERLVIKAVQRMLPKNRLARQLISNLRVYAGAAHPHEAQNPEILDIASMNPKNKRSA